MIPLYNWTLLFSSGTKSVFTLLIASSDEYRCKSWKVLTAEMKEVGTTKLVV